MRGSKQSNISWRLHKRNERHILAPYFYREPVSVKCIREADRFHNFQSLCTERPEFIGRAVYFQSQNSLIAYGTPTHFHSLNAYGKETPFITSRVDGQKYLG